MCGWESKTWATLGVVHSPGHDLGKATSNDLAYTIALLCNTKYALNTDVEGS